MTTAKEARDQATRDREERKRQAEHRRAVAEQEAEAAKAVLESPALAKAFRELTAAYVHVWRSSAHEEVEQREDAWLAIRALEQLEGHLRAKVMGGKVVSFNLRGALAATNKEA